eukprot:748399-Hanusia_phi.AAC.2
MAGAGKSSSEDAGGAWLVEWLMTPGSSMSAGMQKLLNNVFIALFLCIMFLMWLTSFGNIHTYIFFMLALGLFFSVRFFISELTKAQAAGLIDINAPNAERKKHEEEDEEEERSRQQEQIEMVRKIEQEAEVRRRQNKGD